MAEEQGQNEPTRWSCERQVVAVKVDKASGLMSAKERS